MSIRLLLREVRRDEVILPNQTLRLLEGNVHEFIQQRAGLKQLGFAAKEGLLFYVLQEHEGMNRAFSAQSAVVR